MSQYLIVLDLLKKAVGDDYRRHIIVTTSREKGFLIKIAREEGYETFYIPDGVGGRFSELSPVGCWQPPSPVWTSAPWSPARAPWTSAALLTIRGRTRRCSRPV